MYFIATHPEVDKKVYEEIQTVLGDENVDHTNIGNLVYVLIKPYLVKPGYILFSSRLVIHAIITCFI